MRYVVGIDAGGSKTVGLLADEHGHVLAQARGGGANLQVHGLSGVEATLRAVLDQLPAPGPIAAACAGIAGADRGNERASIARLLEDLGLPAPVRVEHDAVIALVAGAPDGIGIVVISGTGSIAYGVDAAGTSTRSGGWGYLLGDEGSAVWLGRVALRSSVRAADGRGPQTTLAQKISRRLDLQIPHELVGWVQEEASLRYHVAELVPLLQEAYDEGDAVAADILNEAARHLAKAVEATAARLELPASFPLVAAGGAFFACPVLLDLLRAHLDLPGAVLTRLEAEPALGAVRLAIRALGQTAQEGAG